MARKKPMTRMELLEKIGYLTSAYGSDAYAEGYKNGVTQTLETIQDWAVTQSHIELTWEALYKKIKEIQKRGRGR